MAKNISGSLSSYDGPFIAGSLSPKNSVLNAEIEGASTRNYSHLHNKPKIEGVTVEGDKTFDDYNLVPITNAELALLLD